MALTDTKEKDKGLNRVNLHVPLKRAVNVRVVEAKHS